MGQPDENVIRKLIWTRSEAVDAKIAEVGFEALAESQQDAWVLSLQLDMPMETAAACVEACQRAGDSEPADETVLADVRNKIAEAFKYGKRKALRTLKMAISRYPSLQ